MPEMESNAIKAGGSARGLAEQTVRARLTENDFLALLERLHGMSEHELARFRAAPENRALLKQFDQYALLQALPYLGLLIVLLLISLTAGALLSS